MLLVTLTIEKEVPSLRIWLDVNDRNINIITDINNLKRNGIITDVIEC